MANASMLESTARRAQAGAEPRRAGWRPGPGAVRGARALLWALIALAGVGGLAGAVRGPSSRAAAHTAAGAQAPPAVAGFAELAVRRWVTVPAAGDDGPRASPERARRLTTTEAVATRRVAGRYWAVTVAVELERLAPSDAPWFFEIGVIDSDKGLVAAGPPAVVPAPVRSDVVAVSVRRGAVPRTDDDTARTVQAVLDALLCGRGDLARYLAPGAQLAPVTPSFDAARLVGLAHVDDAGARRVVRAEAAATSGDLELALVYELVLERRGDRWEIRSVSGAPSRPRPPRRPPTSSSTAPLNAVPSPTVTSPPVPGA